MEPVETLSLFLPTLVLFKFRNWVLYSFIIKKCSLPVWHVSRSEDHCIALVFKRGASVPDQWLPTQAACSYFSGHGTLFEYPTGQCSWWTAKDCSGLGNCQSINKTAADQTLSQRAIPHTHLTPLQSWKLSPGLTGALLHSQGCQEAAVFPPLPLLSYIVCFWYCSIYSPCCCFPAPWFESIAFSILCMWLTW